MGVYIDYRGTLADMGRFDDLIADVIAFSKQAGWEFEEKIDIISGVLAGDLLTRGEAKDSEQQEAGSTEEDPPEAYTVDYGAVKMRFNPRKIPFIEDTCRGVNVGVPDLGMIPITFDGAGRLCQFMELGDHMLQGPLKEFKHFVKFHLWVPTTGATEGHMALCGLLRMIRDKYIPDLAVSDLTGYWASGSTSKLRRTQALHGSFGRAVQESPALRKALTDRLKADSAPEDAAPEDKDAPPVPGEKPAVQ